ncbi:mitochondrial pyruvate carrier 2-like [Pyrus ussuriensis x Pyrus communis]|uniref:Mitochondrial pyruvate carrier n=1 Tax=Pyrus ussuriensis x Pyrus communis TaxID=2448454 RepID=A0A5N5GDI4_9ROSA|nr:mitochondrial pyruvate carrier 2-like [Pyrus ussuriensis x Pyrus communis]
MANSKLQAFWNHPAGPKTILACSGLIWTRYGTVIIPSILVLQKNWNFVSVNFALSVTAMYQLSRKIQHDLSIKNQEVAVVEEE